MHFFLRTRAGNAFALCLVALLVSGASCGGLGGLTSGFKKHKSKTSVKNNGLQGVQNGQFNLGEAAYEILLRDLKSSNGPCKDQRVAGLEARKDRFIYAVNTIFSSNVRAGLVPTLNELLVLIDTGIVPRMVDDVAGVLAMLRTDAATLDALVALANSDAKGGLEVLGKKDVMKLLSRFLNFPEVEQLVYTLANLLANDNRGLVDSGLEFISNSLKDMKTKPAAEEGEDDLRSERVDLVAELLKKVEVVGNDNLGQSVLIPVLDENGKPQAALDANGKPIGYFLDANNDGKADRDGNGNLLDNAGNPVTAPAFDAAGNPQTIEGRHLYLYVDAKRTVLSMLVQLVATAVEKGLHRDLATLFQYATGNRVPYDNGTPGDPTDDYMGFAKDTAVVELNHGSLEMAKYEHLPKLLDTLAVLFEDEQALAEDLLIKVGKVIEIGRDYDKGVRAVSPNAGRSPTTSEALPLLGTAAGTPSDGNGLLTLLGNALGGMNGGTTGTNGTGTTTGGTTGGTGLPGLGLPGFETGGTTSGGSTGTGGTNVGGTGTGTGTGTTTGGTGTTPLPGQQPATGSLRDAFIELADKLFSVPVAGNQSAARVLMQVIHDIGQSARQAPAELAIMTEYQSLVRGDDGDGDKIIQSQSILVDWSKPAIYTDAQGRTIDNRSIMHRLARLIAATDACMIPFVNQTLAEMHLNLLADMNPDTGELFNQLLWQVTGMSPEMSNAVCPGAAQDMAALDALATAGVLDALIPIVKSFKQRGQLRLFIEIMKLQDSHYDTIRKSEEKLIQIFRSGMVEKGFDLLSVMTEIEVPGSQTEKLADVLADFIRHLVDRSNNDIFRPNGERVPALVYLMLGPMDDLDEMLKGTPGETAQSNLMTGALDLIVQREKFDNGTADNAADDYELLENRFIIPFLSKALRFTVDKLGTDVEERIENVTEAQEEFADKIASRKMVNLIDLLVVFRDTQGSDAFDRAMIAILRGNADPTRDVYAVVVKLVAMGIQIKVEADEAARQVLYFAGQVLEPARGMIRNAVSCFSEVFRMDQGKVILSMVRNAFYMGPNGDGETPVEILMDVFKAISPSVCNNAPLTRESLQQKINEIYDLLTGNGKGGLQAVFNVVRNRRR